ncbi:MAG: ATP-binding protein, partial [Lachnospiraceae bacterium]|nr:ATP-binding protein [Lachnospiraceae bacterium]
MGIKIKEDYYDIASTILSKCAEDGMVVLTQNAIVGKAAGKVTEKLFGKLFSKKKKNLPEYFKSALENKLHEIVNKEIGFVINNRESEDDVIRTIAKQKLDEKTMSTGDIDTLKEVIIDSLKKNNVFIDNISDKNIDDFVSKILAGFRKVLFSDINTLSYYGYQKIEKIDKNVEDIKDTGKKTYEYMTEELATKEDIKNMSRHSIKYSLPTKLPLAINPDSFIGRGEKLEELKNKINAHHKVFICGVGGIGKSELAAQYVLAHKNEYDTILHMNYMAGEEKGDFVERSGLRRLIESLAISNYPPFAGSANKGRDAMQNADTPPSIVEERKAYYEAKLSCLRGLVSEKVLIVIDNFNVDNDEALSEILSLNCKMIFTTKYNYSKRYESVDLSILDEEAALKLFYVHSPEKKSEDENDIKQIIKKLGYHTTAIILIATQKEYGGISAKDMRGRITDGLKNAGKDAIDFTKDGDSATYRDKTAYECLNIVFNIAELSDESHDILANLSLLPSDGIEQGKFMRWCGISEGSPQKKALNELIKMRWVEKSDEGVIYLIPVISDLAFDKAEPDYIKCSGLLNGFIDEYKSFDIEKKYKNAPYLEYIASKLARLEIKNDEDNVLDTEENISFSYAYELEANRSYIYADVLYNKNVDICKLRYAKHPEAYGNDYASSLNNYANLLKNTGKPEAAEEKYKKAEEIYGELYAKHPEAYGNDYAMSLNNYAALLADTGKPEAAEEKYKKAEEIYGELYAKHPEAYGKEYASSLNNYANLLKNTGKPEAAEEKYKKAEEIYGELYAK